MKSRGHFSTPNKLNTTTGFRIIERAANILPTWTRPRSPRTLNANSSFVSCTSHTACCREGSRAPWQGKVKLSMGTRPWKARQGKCASVGHLEQQRSPGACYFPQSPAFAPGVRAREPAPSASQCSGELFQHRCACAHGICSAGASIKAVLGAGSRPKTLHTSAKVTARQRGTPATAAPALRMHNQPSVCSTGSFRRVVSSMPSARSARKNRSP